MSFFLRKIPTLHDPINQKEVASVESLTTRTIDDTQLSILRFITPLVLSKLYYGLLRT